jgi:hypothetical protein
MSLGQYTNFIEPAQIPMNIFWMLLGIPVNYALKQLWQKHPVRITRHDIWKSYNMTKIFLRMIHFISVLYFLAFTHKLHIKKFEDKCGEMALNDLLQGFLIFQKIEPEKAHGIAMAFKKFTEQLQVNKITGLTKKPDLSDLETE